MRIIAGRAKGYKLISPKNLDTRPTSDRVKESIFNIIQGKIYNKTVIDLFSGTGNLGIEALSRDAKMVYFVDKSRNSVNIIKKNLDNTNFLTRAEIILDDAVTAIGKLGQRNVQADIIFIDPPYNKGLGEISIEYITKHKLLNSSGIIVVEHDKHEQMPDEIHGTLVFRRKDYGNTSVSFYRQKEEV